MGGGVEEPLLDGVVDPGPFGFDVVRSSDGEVDIGPPDVDEETIYAVVEKMSLKQELMSQDSNNSQ